MKTKFTAWVVAVALAGVACNATASFMTLGSVTNNGGGSWTVSSGAGSVPDANIEAWLGLIPGTLDSMAVTTNVNLVTEGSAIKKTQDMLAGDVLSFDWEWFSNETTANQPDQFADFAFYSLTFQGATYLVDRFDPNGTVGTVSWVAPTAGTMTLGIGVVDVGDTDYDSWLNLNNVVIPEPGTLSLIGVFAAGFIFVRRRLV